MAVIRASEELIHEAVQKLLLYPHRVVGVRRSGFATVPGDYDVVVDVPGVPLDEVISPSYTKHRDYRVEEQGVVVLSDDGTRKKEI